MVLPVHFTTVKGRTVRYARLGQGPPLVLLHGYPDNLQLWSEVGPILAGSFDVIAVDWPGMGMSESLPGGATPFDMASRLISLLDHWKIDRAAIVGADMGGQPALMAAARYPHRVSHLIVTGSLLQCRTRAHPGKLPSCGASGSISFSWAAARASSSAVP